MQPLDLVNDIRLVRICQLVAAVVTIYDHILNFDAEVELIWKKGWSLTKVLYILIRYSGDIILAFTSSVFLSNNLRTTEFCLRYFHFQGWGGVASVWIMQVMMQLRIYAMYQKSLKIVAFMAVCFTLEVLAQSLILGLSYHRMGAIPEPLPGLRICTPANVPRFFYAFWLPVITFEGILFGLAAWLGIKHLRSLGTWKVHRMLNLLVRDSMVYFFIILVVYVTNGITWLLLPPIWIEIPEGFCLAVTVIMGSRLSLNLRGAYWKPHEVEESTTDESRLRNIPRPVNNRHHATHLSWALSPSRSSENIPLGNVAITPTKPSSKDSAEFEAQWRWNERSDP